MTKPLPVIDDGTLDDGTEEYAERQGTLHCQRFGANWCARNCVADVTPELRQYYLRDAMREIGIVGWYLEWLDRRGTTAHAGQDSS